MESSAHHGCTVLAAESHATRIPIAVLSRLQPVPEVVVAATLSLVFKRRHGLGVLARKAYCIMSQSSQSAYHVAAYLSVLVRINRYERFHSR